MRIETTNPSVVSGESRYLSVHNHLVSIQSWGTVGGSNRVLSVNKVPDLYRTLITLIFWRNCATDKLVVYIICNVE